MALKEFEQPEIIDINDSLRLRKYDGHYELFLPGYQNPVVYQNSEGIFDESRVPNLDYVKGMCTFLAKVGELYYIEAKENGTYIPIGDVTVKWNITANADNAYENNLDNTLLNQESAAAEEKTSPHFL